MAFSLRLAALAAVVVVPLGIAATSYAMTDGPEAPKVPPGVQLDDTPSGTPSGTPSDPGGAGPGGPSPTGSPTGPPTGSPDDSPGDDIVPGPSAGDGDDDDDDFGDDG
ncbi:hypothetical protein GCM10011583_22540 [Streptomyces camponoticapitis]|uniref:Small hydrophilic protein n=1 Tax=Streptomyces camponoticapitis TaxID=1616125 RepID=A0ABQ2E6A4_9ACTN|nr:small hydrophilic protein [Streptomyces camponoticapitis]GGJ90615.1 hypothetical protein GCM10011583_22540 [Streptomyces camponoticapitis]